MKHLWEYDHPYYCSESEYHQGSKDNWGRVEHEGWRSFYEEWQDSDPDLNLLFRWDWEIADEEENGATVDTLWLFFLLQRKGLYLPVAIRNIRAEDEPAVLAYLRAKARTLAAIWEPLRLPAAGGR